MKTAGAILIICSAAWATTAFNVFNAGNQRMGGLEESPAYTLDVERPMAFLKKHLPAALVKPEGRLFGDDAIEEVATVRLRRGAQTVDMEVEFLSGFQMDVNEYYVFLSGTPATLDDTYALALRLCDLAKIPDDRIVAWYNEKGYESPLGSAQLQTDREGERQHSVEVLSSLVLDGDKQWRVLYTIYFVGGDGVPLAPTPKMPAGDAKGVK